MTDYAEDYRRATELGRRIVAEGGADPDLRAEAVAAFADRCARAWLLRDRWERAARPTSAKGSKGQTVAHPMLAALERAETALLAAERALAPSVDGRIGARLPHLKADLRKPRPAPLGESPAARLRAAR
jgi:hypothetical protein